MNIFRCNLTDIMAKTKTLIATHSESATSGDLVFANPLFSLPINRCVDKWDEVHKVDMWTQSKQSMKRIIHRKSRYVYVTKTSLQGLNRVRASWQEFMTFWKQQTLYPGEFSSSPKTWKRPYYNEIEYFSGWPNWYYGWSKASGVNASSQMRHLHFYRVGVCVPVCLEIDI